MCLIGEKTPKLDKKTRRKTKDLIDEKSPKLDKETRRKTNHLIFYILLYRGEKPPKSS